MPRPDSFSSLTSTKRSWFGYGIGRNNTASSTLKIAAEAPMPSASVRIATRVKAGDLTRVRKAYFRSFITKCDDGIDFHGTACGKKTRQQSGKEEKKNRSGEEKRIVRRGFVELGGDQAAKCQSCSQARDQSKDDRPHSLIENEPQNIVRLRAERHPDTDLSRALRNAVGDCAVDPDAGEQERNGRENGEQPHHEARLPDSLPANRVHRLRDRDGKTRTALP